MSVKPQPDGGQPERPETDSWAAFDGSFREWGRVKIGHHEAEKAALIEKLRDPNYLPTVDEVFQAFDGYLGVNFTRFCFDGEDPIYELLTNEHLQGLSDYFEARVAELGGTPEKPVTILEVGAGDGRLSHFLQQKLAAKLVPVRIIVTDPYADKNLNPYHIEPRFPVEQMGYQAALQQYQPDIVLSCWMPYGEDWTADFRACGSVKEYVLMGETDGGCVGSSDTWGYPYDENFDYIEGYEALYERDGFDREEVGELWRNQICRTDWGDRNGPKHSSTVSFKKAAQ